MNDLTLLRTLRDDVAEPDAARLAPAFDDLSRAMNPPVKRRAPRARWVLAGIATTAAASLAVAGAVTLPGRLGPTHPQSAPSVVTTPKDMHFVPAASVLRQAATAAITYSDPVVKPGQYLKFDSHADYVYLKAHADGKATVEPISDTLELYVPGDPEADWVVRSTSTVGGSDGGPTSGIYRGKDGKVYGDQTPWGSETRIEEIPTGSGAETLAYFDSHYEGGSASRDENNWVRITDILHEYPADAKLRASLFEALALIPGATATDGVANLDGRVGVAIGRTESKRMGQRDEIIIDPATGQIIGERTLYPKGEMPDGKEHMRLTAVTTSVVDSAP